MSEQALPAHIYIDGSYGEGGGRNFRDTVMYATIKALQGWRGKVTINNIRTSRPDPGIRISLLGIVEFCHQVLDDVQNHGVQDGSLEATFDFSKAKPSCNDTINIDVNGVGSAWLLFLAVHPVLLYTACVKTVISCNGLKKWDGCVRYVQSTVSSMRVGVSNPYSKYILPEPDQDLWCDEHFSDMIVPYMAHPPKESDAVSPHHQSAIYVACQFLA